MWKQNQSQDKKFQNPPPGTYGAVCYQVIDLGTQAIQWEGDTKLQRKVRIAWELDEKMTDGRPFITSKKYTVSFNEKARLYNDLISWRGRPFTQEELKGFDPANLIGAPCMITLVQKGEYVNVASIAKLPKGMTPLTPVNPTVCFLLDKFDQKVYDALSNSLKDQISSSPEYIAIVGNQSAPNVGSDGLESDIPF